MRVPWLWLSHSLRLGVTVHKTSLLFSISFFFGFNVFRFEVASTSFCCFSYLGLHCTHKTLNWTEGAAAIAAGEYNLETLFGIWQLGTGNWQLKASQAHTTTAVVARRQPTARWAWAPWAAQDLVFEHELQTCSMSFRSRSNTAATPKGKHSLPASSLFRVPSLISSHCRTVFVCATLVIVNVTSVCLGGCVFVCMGVYVGVCMLQLQPQRRTFAAVCTTCRMRTWAAAFALRFRWPHFRRYFYIFRQQRTHIYVCVCDCDCATYDYHYIAI